jgi:hypothetical protein
MYVLIEKEVELCLEKNIKELRIFPQEEQAIISQKAAWYWKVAAGEEYIL